VPGSSGSPHHEASPGAWLALGLLNEAFVRLVAREDLGSFWREVCGSARWIVQARRMCAVLTTGGAPEVTAMSDRGAWVEAAPPPRVASGSWLDAALEAKRASWMRAPSGDERSAGDLGAWLLEADPELVLQAPLLAAQRTLGTLLFAVKGASDADRGAMLACGASFGLYVGAAYSSLQARIELAAATERLQRQNDELERADIELRLQLDIVRAQHADLLRLSTPIIQVGQGVLALPVIGAVDRDRAQRMTDEILDAVSRGGARWLILDLTGAQIPDADSAARLLRIVRAVELLGSGCLVSGVPSSLARSLLELGADLGAVPTFRSLRQALEHARRAAGPADRPRP